MHYIVKGTTLFKKNTLENLAFKVKESQLIRQIHVIF